MGRTRKYATEEEAHEAKKQQMRENYQKRKAAKAEPKPASVEDVPRLRPEPKPTKRTKKESTPEIVQQPPSAEYLKMTKEELLEKFGVLLDSF